MLCRYLCSKIFVLQYLPGTLDELGRGATETGGVVPLVQGGLEGGLEEG